MHIKGCVRVRACVHVCVCKMPLGISYSGNSAQAAHPGKSEGKAEGEQVVGKRRTAFPSVAGLQRQIPSCFFSPGVSLCSNSECTGSLKVSFK